MNSNDFKICKGLLDLGLALLVQISSPHLAQIRFSPQVDLIHFIRLIWRSS